MIKQKLAEYYTKLMLSVINAVLIALSVYNLISFLVTLSVEEAYTTSALYMTAIGSSYVVLNLVIALIIKISLNNSLKVSSDSNSELSETEKKPLFVTPKKHALSIIFRELRKEQRHFTESRS